MSPLKQLDFLSKALLVVLLSIVFVKLRGQRKRVHFEWVLGGVRHSGAKGRDFPELREFAGEAWVFGEVGGGGHVYYFHG